MIITPPGREERRKHGQGLRCSSRTRGKTRCTVPRRSVSPLRASRNSAADCSTTWSRPSSTRSRPRRLRLLGEGARRLDPDALHAEPPDDPDQPLALPGPEIHNGRPGGPNSSDAMARSTRSSLTGAQNGRLRCARNENRVQVHADVVPVSGRRRRASNARLPLHHHPTRGEHRSHPLALIAGQLQGAGLNSASVPHARLSSAASFAQELPVVRQAVDDRHDLTAPALLLEPKPRCDLRGDGLVPRAERRALAVTRRTTAFGTDSTDSSAVDHARLHGSQG